MNPFFYFTHDIIFIHQTGDRQSRVDPVVFSRLVSGPCIRPKALESSIPKEMQNQFVVAKA